MKISKVKSNVFILGSGGFAKELEAYFHSTHQFKIRLVGRDLTLESYQREVKNPSAYSIMGSGKCSVKQKMLSEIVGPFISYIHPSATVIKAEIGEGSVLAPGSVVAPYAQVGKHVLCNYNSTIGHDTIIGDLSVISPNAAISGNVRLGNRVYIGAGATIKEGLIIGAGATIGMGAVVVKDVEPGVIVAGVPARPLY